MLGPGANTNRAFRMKVRLNSFPSVGGEHYVGILYGSNAATFAPEASQAFYGLKVTSTTVQWYYYSGSGAAETRDLGSVPLEIEFFVSQGEESHAAYRTGRLWYLDVTAGTAYYNLSFFMALYNKTANGNALDVDVLHWQQVADPRHSKTTTAGRLAWSTGMAPQEDDQYWGNVEMVENWSEYTNNLDCRPASDATFEDISEGIISSGSSGYKFGSQPRIYTSSGAQSSDYSATISSSGGYALTNFETSAPNGKTVTWSWEVGKGLSEPLDIGCAQFNLYWYRSAQDLPVTTHNHMLFYFVHEDNKVFYYALRWITIPTSVFKWRYQNSFTGYDCGGTTTSFGLSYPSYFQLSMAVCYDVTQGRSWFYNSRNNVNNWQYDANDGRYHWMACENISGTLGDEMPSSKPITQVRVYFYRRENSNASTEWFRIYPMVITRGPVMLHEGSIYDSTLSSLAAWRYPTEGTSQADYYDTGRYSQFRVRQTGA